MQGTVGRLGVIRQGEVVLCVAQKFALGGPGGTLKASLGLQ